MNLFIFPPPHLSLRVSPPQKLRQRQSPQRGNPPPAMPEPSARLRRTARR
ncbi:hypothetical protein [Mastigocladopsis repens]|nr:hypothetical protein [Mastigocladopsis repens]